MGFKVNDIFLIEEFMRGQEYSIELFLNSEKQSSWKSQKN